MGDFDNQDFAGRNVLVTGATSGIGRATAELFAARGARVAIAGTSAERGAEVADGIRGAGGDCIFIQGDMADPAQAAACVTGAVKAFGRLHCAFNNAGITGLPTPFHKLPLEEWNRLIAVDLTSVFVCMKHQIEHMIEAGGGAILNNASISAIVGHPGQAAYASAKHGVLALTKVASQEVARHGIRVNAICPGGVDTPMFRSFVDGNPGLEEKLLADLPAGRLGKPEEVAETAVWLCSDAASFVSGATLLVDAATVAR